MTIRFVKEDDVVSDMVSPGQCVARVLRPGECGYVYEWADGGYLFVTSAQNQEARAQRRRADAKARREDG